jgi:hypothetical protein
MADDLPDDLDLQLERANSRAEAAIARMRQAIADARFCRQEFDSPDGHSRADDYRKQFDASVREWREAEAEHREAVAIIHALHEQMLKRWHDHAQPPAGPASASSPAQRRG